MVGLVKIANNAVSDSVITIVITWAVYVKMVVQMDGKDLSVISKKVKLLIKLDEKAKSILLHQTC